MALRVREEELRSAKEEAAPPPPPSDAKEEAAPPLELEDVEEAKAGVAEMSEVTEVAIRPTSPCAGADLVVEELEAEEPISGDMIYVLACLAWMLCACIRSLCTL